MPARELYDKFKAWSLRNENRNAFNYILPITICAAASYLTIKLLYPSSRYIETRYDDLASLFRKA